MYALRHSSQAANRLRLIEQWEAMRGEGITAAKAADIIRVPCASLYRCFGSLTQLAADHLQSFPSSLKDVFEFGEDRAETFFGFCRDFDLLLSD